MIDYAYIFTLTVVVTFLLIERYIQGEQHRSEKNKLLEENSRLVKAVISKNANDYVMTTSIDKVAPEEKPPTNPDLIPEEAVTDDEFFDAIGKGLKQN